MGTSEVDWDKIETDADGKRVGLSAPISYPTDSNDLYTSGWSFGSLSSGQFMTYSVDGLHVPPEFFADRIGARTPGFELNLLEFSAMVSAPRYLVGDRWGATAYYGTDWEAAVAAAYQTETLTVHRIFFEGWAVNWSLLPFQTQYQSLHDAPNSAYPDPEKNLKPKVDKALTETCKKKLNELLGKLRSKITDIGALADKVYRGDGITLSITDDPIDFVYKKGFTVRAKTTRERAPAGETRNRTSIVINRNIFGKNYEILTFIHELLHTTKKGDDHKDIALKIAGIEGIESTLKNYLKNRADPDRESSAFINSWLNKYCDINAEGVEEWKEVLTTIGVK